MKQEIESEEVPRQEESNSIKFEPHDHFNSEEKFTSFFEKLDEQKKQYSADVKDKKDPI